MVVALKTLLVALEALAAADLAALLLREQRACVVWAVVAVVAVAPPAMAGSAEQAAWLFNMPTIAMWPQEI